MASNDQTAKVLQHHVDAFMAQDHKEMLDRIGVGE